MGHEDQDFGFVYWHLLFLKGGLQLDSCHVFNQTCEGDAAQYLNQSISVDISKNGIKSPGNADEGNNAQSAPLEGLVSMAVERPKVDDGAVEYEEDGAENEVSSVAHDGIYHKQQFINIYEELHIQNRVFSVPVARECGCIRGAVQGDRVHDCKVQNKSYYSYCHQPFILRIFCECF